MQSNQDFEIARKQYENSRNGSMIFGGIVYAGVVVSATTLFISFILTAFPANAYATRFIMGIAGFLIGCSMIAFPIALHNWAVTGWHRGVAIGLYIGEIAIVALNTIVSFGALLFKNAGMDLPAWIAWYEPFSVVSMVYTLLAWGLMFLMDPQIKARAKEREAIDKFRARVSQRMNEYLETSAGEDAIMTAANQSIQQAFLPKEKKDWGTKPTQTYVPPKPQNEPTYHPVSMSQPKIEAVPSGFPSWRCQNCTSDNLGDGKFCGACGAPREVAFSSNGKDKPHFQ